MKRMSPEAKVGLLVLAGLLILVYMTLKVGKLGFGPGGGYVLYLRTESAEGIAKDTDVLMAGIPVGVVADIRLDGHDALVVLRIQDKVQLPKDTTASIRTHGLLGEKYVSVAPGQSSHHLKNGDPLAAAATSGDLDRLISRLNQVFDDVKRVTAALSNVLGTPEGEQDLKQTLAGLRDSAQGLRDVIHSNREGIRETVANLRAVAEQLRQLVDKNSDDVESILANARTFSETLATRSTGVVDGLDRLTSGMNTVIAENRENLRESLVNLREGTARLSKAVDEARRFFADARNPDGTLGRLMSDTALYDEMRAAMAELKTVLGRLERGEGTLGKLLSDDALYSEFRGSMENLRGVTEKINQGQGTLGKLVNDTTVHENLNTTLTGITDFVAGTSRFQFEPSFWGEYLFDQGETRGYFNLDIRPRQDRFYRLGVVRDPLGKMSTKTTKIKDETTGQTISEEKKTTIKDDFKLSAQIGKRFSFLTVRGGLLESTAGAALDGHFWDDRLSVTLEAFDFGEDQGGPHLRASGRVHFLDHFFLTGGVDEYVGPGGRSDIFLGGGIHFLDDDLRYMFSTLGALAK